MANQVSKALPIEIKHLNEILIGIVEKINNRRSKCRYI